MRMYSEIVKILELKPIDYDMEIRKHEFIVQRLKTIKEMEDILQGKSAKYQKYMRDKTFLGSIEYNLRIEKELLQDLYRM